MNFSSILLNWYAINKRDLPWRNIDNPYVIWVAEVVFQQTRIDQGLPYFVRFMDKFPTVEILAKASEAEVLKMWQGLGYYSRARNLHFSAKYVVNDLQGIFPNSYSELLKLKGVGPYIAAEVASVCFDEVVAAVDGNVQRVIARFFGIKDPVNSPSGEKQIRALANEHIDAKVPGDFNQALMDFGSSVCKPKSPLCETCVFNESCWAFRNQMQKTLPVKIKKVKVKKRFFNFLLYVSGNKLAVVKRKSGDVWQGLFQPMLVETTEEVEIIGKLDLSGFLFSRSIRQLSHQKLFLSFWVVESDTKFEDHNSEIEWHSYEELFQLPVPKSIEELFSSNDFETLVNKGRLN